MSPTLCFSEFSEVSMNQDFHFFSVRRVSLKSAKFPLLHHFRPASDKEPCAGKREVDQPTPSPVIVDAALHLSRLASPVWEIISDFFWVRGHLLMLTLRKILVHNNNNSPLGSPSGMQLYLRDLKSSISQRRTFVLTEVKRLTRGGAGRKREPRTRTGVPNGRHKPTTLAQDTWPETVWQPVNLGARI